MNNAKDIIEQPSEPCREDEVRRSESAIELDVGSYWRVTGNDVEGFEKGEVVLLAQIEEVDGKVHSIGVIEHPSKWRGEKDYSTYLMLIDEFISNFAPEHDGLTVRAQELNERRDAVDAMQGSLKRAEDGAAGLLTGPESQQAIAVLVGSATELERHAEYLATRAAEVEKAVSAMMPFVRERALIASLRAEAVKKRIDRIEESIKTIGLYTGADVDVVTLTEGAPGDPDAQIHIMQRLLYMDEESFLHAAEGGADFNDLDEFGQQLASDEKVRSKILPFERCVVAMQFRRREKRYTDDGLTNILLNANNHRAFLLIRNGMNIHAVFSSLEHLHRLYPRQDEFEKPFQGFDGRRITVNDLRYVRARADVDRLTLYYKRILVLLWGLYDRTDVIGALGTGEHLNLLDMKVQRDWFRFVSDDENVIGEGRDEFYDWVRKHNALVQSGSRVLCLWDELIEQSNAPGCFSRHIYHKPTRCYMPDERWSVKIANRDHEEFYVKTEVEGWAPDGRSNRAFNARVEIDPRQYGEMSFLCLDAVEATDIDYYLNNRETRQRYIEYAKALLAAKAVVARDLEEEKPAREAIENALKDGGIELSVRETKLVGELIRQWRARNRGASLPQVNSIAYRAAYEEILDWAWIATNQRRDRYRELAAALAGEGDVLEAYVSGRNRIACLIQGPTAELDERMGEHLFVKRALVTEMKTKMRVDRVEWILPTATRPEKIPIVGAPGRAGSFGNGRIYMPVTTCQRILNIVKRDWDRAAADLKGVLECGLPIAMYRESSYNRIEVLWVVLSGGKVVLRVTDWMLLVQEERKSEWDWSAMGYWQQRMSLTKVVNQLKRGKKGIGIRKKKQTYEVAFAISREFAAELDRALAQVTAV